MYKTFWAVCFIGLLCISATAWAQAPPEEPELPEPPVLPDPPENEPLPTEMANDPTPPAEPGPVPPDNEEEEELIPPAVMPELANPPDPVHPPWPVLDGIPAPPPPVPDVVIPDPEPDVDPPTPLADVAPPPPPVDVLPPSPPPDDVPAVSASNGPPIVDAGGTRVIECVGASGGVSVTLDGSATLDPDGDVISFLWSALDIAFDDENSSTPTAVFPLGTTAVTLAATDQNGNSASATVDVIVEDTASPAVTLVGDADVTLECGVDIYEELGATASDVCDSEVVVVIAGAVIDEVGDYTITYTGTDDSGNSAFVTRIVHVVDTTAPVVTLNGANPLTLECGTEYAELGAVVADACDSEPAFEISGSVDHTILGSYEVTYTATDASTNETVVKRTVNVVDTTAPVVTLVGDADVTLECGVDVYEELGATASDVCDSEVVIAGAVIDKVGDYTITYTSTDASENSASEARIVHVVDTTAPVVTLNGANPLTLECGTEYAELGAVITDACDSEPAFEISGSVDHTVLGSYEVTYTATDASTNETVVKRTVNVVDTTPPTVVTQNMTVPLDDEGAGSITPEQIDGGSTDNCDIASLSLDITAFDCDDLNNPVTVTLTVTDASGNSAFKTAVVTVVDKIAPTIVSIGPPVVLECTNPVGESVTLSVDAFDACDQDLDIVWYLDLYMMDTQTLPDKTPSITATFGLGSHMVRVVITDDSGNATEGSVSVMIQDTTPAEIAAALNPTNKPKSKKSNKSSKSSKSSKRSKYSQVVAQATDFCDASPVVTALINQPLTFSDVIDNVKYKKSKKENQIEIKIGKKIEVTLWGPDEVMLQGLLNDALVRGGFLVTDGQVLRLQSKELSSKSSKSSKSNKSSKSSKSSKVKDPRKGHYKYTFDLGLTLEEVDGVAVRLVVSAVDASGNESGPVTATPPAKNASKPVLTKPVLSKPTLDGEADGALVFGVTNYPNPFNPETIIKYTVPEAGDVRLVIYNVVGQQVRELVNAAQSPGQYGVRWNGRDAMGRSVSSGVYFYRLVAGADIAIKKMVLMK